MNVSDTEIAYSILNDSGGYNRVNDEKDADVILLMTCSIREGAEKKIWKRLDSLNHLKGRKPNLQIGILGCKFKFEWDPCFVFVFLI
jgi:tRNA-2-methylthio-N6-dimethylallyladenosine synthase